MFDHSLYTMVEWSIVITQHCMRTYLEMGLECEMMTKAEKWQEWLLRALIEVEKSEVFNCLFLLVFQNLLSIITILQSLHPTVGAIRYPQ